MSGCDLFRTAGVRVFPYRNGSDRLIMDTVTEKVLSIKHCHVDVTNYANPINCCCDSPELEGRHKKWVHEHGLKTNQGPSAAKTLPVIDTFPKQRSVSATV